MNNLSISHHDYIVVLTTCSSEEEAKNIAKKLVEEHLIACANVIANMFSIYMWQGQLCEEGEVLMVMKSRREHFDKIQNRIQVLHSFDVPEIIALPIVGGSQAYLDWVYQETQNK